ncbi:hypothetical protein Hanom_Chr01g00042821 [Helianthus anomalus]
MGCGFIKLWRPYSFGGPRPKHHLAYPWAGPGGDLTKDIDCLFYNKIVYEKPGKIQAMQYQKIVDVSFAKGIKSGRYWKSKWRDLEIDEFLKGTSAVRSLKRLLRKL